MLIGKINTLIWLHCMKDGASPIEDKRKDKELRAHLLEPQKAHPIGEFVIVRHAYIIPE